MYTVSEQFESMSWHFVYSIHALLYMFALFPNEKYIRSWYDPSWVRAIYDNDVSDYNIYC